MNIALWVVQILLALAYLATGAAKLFQPREKLASRMTWVESFSDWQVKTIGALEVLGALGLVLPAVTGIAVVLVPIAATGLGVVMIGAVATHLRLKEGWAVASAPLVLGLLDLFVAWGRFGPYPL